MIAHKSFYFIRHGITQWNMDNRLHGHSDIPLHDKGRQQARDARALIESLPITHIFYSPLFRAEETMRIVSENISCPKKAHHGLKERNFGSYEGKLKEEIPAAMQIALGIIKEDASEHIVEGESATCIHDGETTEIFLARVANVIHDILAHEGTPLIVAHGGIYGALCLNMSIENRFLANCSVVHFSPNSSKNSWTVVPVK